MKLECFLSELCLGVSYDREIFEAGMYFITISLIQDSNRVQLRCVFIRSTRRHLMCVLSLTRIQSWAESGFAMDSTMLSMNSTRSSSSREFIWATYKERQQVSPALCGPTYTWEACMTMLYMPLSKSLFSGGAVNDPWRLTRWYLHRWDTLMYIALLSHSGLCENLAFMKLSISRRALGCSPNGTGTSGYIFFYYEFQSVPAIKVWRFDEHARITQLEIKLRCVAHLIRHRR